VSRIILPESDTAIDAKRIGCTTFSHRKTAPGVGAAGVSRRLRKLSGNGAAPAPRLRRETVDDMAQRFPLVQPQLPEMGGSLERHAGGRLARHRVERAPRPVFVTGGTDDKPIRPAGSASRRRLSIAFGRWIWHDDAAPATHAGHRGHLSEAAPTPVRPPAVRIGRPRSSSTVASNDRVDAPGVSRVAMPTPAPPDGRTRQI
jgi:hypothetical protein